jgi:hypothetical protein
MKWVRCLYNNPYALGQADITVGKVYKVLYNYGEDNETIIIIYNDLGKESYWSMLGADGRTWFEDVTAEIRDNKINQVLG